MQYEKIWLEVNFILISYMYILQIVAHKKEFLLA